MTTTGTAERITRALQNGVANLDGRGASINEATTRSVLIDAVLDALGYPLTFRTPEEGAANNRPDYLCYLSAVNAQSRNPTLIVEAKTVGTSFDQAPSGQARVYSPDRQIQRYLSNHPSSGKDTLGVLTDGVRWRVYRRSDAGTDVELDSFFDLTTLARPGQPTFDDEPAPLDKFIHLLSQSARSLTPQPSRKPTPNLVDSFLETVQIADEPSQILKDMMGEKNLEIREGLDNEESLTGVRKEALLDWLVSAIGVGPKVQVDTEERQFRAATLSPLLFNSSTTLPVS